MPRSCQSQLPLSNEVISTSFILVSSCFLPNYQIYAGMGAKQYTSDWIVEQHTEAHKSDMDQLDAKVKSIAEHELNYKIVNASHSIVSLHISRYWIVKLYCIASHETICFYNPRPTMLGLGFLTDYHKFNNMPPDSIYTHSPIKSRFTTNLLREIYGTSKNVVAWSYGHTHFNCDHENQAT